MSELRMRYDRGTMVTFGNRVPRRLAHPAVVLATLALCAAILLPAERGYAFSISEAVSLYPEAPEIDARSAILLDYDSATVLFEHNADEIIPPASLTKVVGMHTVFEAVDRGEAALTDLVEVPEHAWARNMPRYSSLMFLGPDQEVTLEELVYGLAIPSGNDAAIAVAEHIADGVPEFVAQMNEEMRRLGLERTRFVEPSGLSPENQTTAREFLQFLYDYLERRPDALERFHALEEYAYPLDRNRSPGNGEPTITQRNRNVLLREYDGADGIKTGYIPASRYNLAFSAERDGRRLIGVLLGVPGDTHLEGSAERARQAAALLDYGFEEFETVTLGHPDPEPVPVWFGSAPEAAVYPDDHDTVALPRGAIERLEGEIVLPREREAPLYADERLGEVRYSVAGVPVHTRALYVAETVERGPWWRVVWDHLRRFFLRLADRF